MLFIHFGINFFGSGYLQSLVNDEKVDFFCTDLFVPRHCEINLSTLVKRVL